jgi:hypothetical protein
MINAKISSRYGPYSLKYATINKLFGLGLAQAQINKVAKYAYGSITL